MKKFNIFILSFTILIFMNCEAKPEKSFYGIPNDDKDKFIAGLILNAGSQTTSSGTVIDSRSGLEWKKCTQGQAFRSANNDCQGNRSSAAPTINTEIGSYGATVLPFCDLEGNFCNTASLPQVLRQEEQTRNKATSAIFVSCSVDRTGGYTNWRVPTPIELKALSSTGKTAMSINFPNTLDNNYWSSWGNEQDLTGATAKGVSFSQKNFGEDQNVNKTTALYVRCVRNVNGL